LKVGEEQAQVPSTELGSPDRFGYSWDRYNDLLPEHEEQFLRWTAPLQREDWVGKRFLDGGCGIGRNSFWPMKYGAAGGLAADVDERTLSRARANLAPYPSVEVRNQSLYDLPEGNQFDIAFSIGVIHHLESPEIAVRRMVDTVKPGGLVLVWLYGRENNGWIVKFFDPIRIGLFSRLPLGFVHALSWPLTLLLWCFLRIGLGSIAYFRLLRKFSFTHLRAIVFDHMIPKIARYYRREEAIALLQGAGLQNVDAVWVNEMSWTVRGVKP
jgi:SAM-dependent methyltransferase